MRRAVRFPIAAMFVLAAACGGGPSSAPHYVITGTFWSGACESVSTYDQDGSPVHFERCLAVADARNDGGASQDPVLGELALVRGYDIHGILLPERCDGATEPVVPKLDQGETGRITCHLIALAPDEIDTSKPPVITIQNIAEQVQNSGG